MSLTEQIAKHFREVHFGGNWTWVNMKDTLADVNWQQATTQVYNCNTIATLVYHINYYIHEVLKVLHGGQLSASDKYSFDGPPITSQEDCENLLNKTWADAENFANLIEKLPESRMWENLAGEEYGIYYRNLHGIIEHTHYHLGQIVIIKKVLLQVDGKSVQS
ncbi:MAG: DUF1572 domain-containing protein [Ignavibacteriae bacterium]|nr:DUF1572 domain-containing protein [Ignavibacteriota bacterium]